MALRKDFISLKQNYDALLITGNDHLTRLIDFARTEFNIEITKSPSENFIEFDLFHTSIEIRIQIPPRGIKNMNGKLVTYINKGEEVTNLTLSFDLNEDISLPDDHLLLRTFSRFYFTKLLDIIVQEETIQF